MENALYSIFLFIFGSSIGSFLNVYRFRYPKSISIVYPRSFCPKCKKNIPWFFNIPIISWFLLMGKCYFCKTKIPYHYPFIEFITAILCALNIFSISQLSPNYIVNLFGLTFFTSLIIAVSLIDLDNLVIPNNLLILGAISGLFFNLINRTIFFGDSFLIIIFQYLILSLIFLFFFEIFNFIISFLIKKEAFGFGDSKYLFMISTWLGLKGVLSTFILSLYVGGIITIILILLRLIPLKGKIPFGPYLSISAYIVGMFGPDRIILFLKNFHSIG